MSVFTDDAWLNVNNMKSKAKRVDDLLSQLIAMKNDTGKLYVTDSDEIQMILQALGNQVATTCQQFSDMEDALKAGDEYGNLKSHDEKHILNGCVSLMWSLVGAFEDWLDYAADDNGLISLKDKTDPEMGFAHSVNYSEIVRRLFLWNTGHSGGTSTGAKCKLLGVDGSRAVKFEFVEDDDGE